MQRLSIVPNHVKTATFCRAFWPEGADNPVAALPHGTANLTNIASPLTCGRKKVKYGSVVPDVKSRRAQCNFRDVPDEPIHTFGSRTQPFSSHVNCRLGNVQHCDVSISAPKQIVNER